MAGATISGCSTLGVTFGYGVEETAGEKPAKFTRLDRINSIGGITMETETIDASALEDFVTKYIRGRADTGGSFSVTVNYTPETNEQWTKVLADFLKLDGAKRMWFETVVPGFEDGFFVVAQPPTAIPEPEFSQNELLTVEIPLTIEEYVGLDAKVQLDDFVGE